MRDSIRFLFVFISLFIVPMVCGFSYAQDSEKNSVRLKLDYIKVMDQESYLDIKAIARIDKQMVEVPNIDLDVYYEYEDEEFSLGNTRTNINGKGRFKLPSLKEIKADSSHTYSIGISFGGNEKFKRASKSVSFKDAHVATKLTTKDSINFIEARLTDATTGLPVSESSLGVRVKRLINPLRIGEEFNYTDENGEIVVPVEEGIPGLEGNLTIEVVLSESDDYGTVMAIVEAPYGTPIFKDTSFDERSLWGPRGKTPLFILFFTLLLIIATWGPIFYLILNLYKISKS